MKKKIIMSVLFLFFYQISIGQVTPVREYFKLNNSYKVYECNNFNLAKEVVSNQDEYTIETIDKSDVKIVPDSEFDKGFIEGSVSISKYNMLKQNKARLKISYVIDSNGNTISTSILMKNTSYLNLSSIEVQSILEKSLNHKFILSNKPSSLSSFKMIVGFDFFIR